MAELLTIENAFAAAQYTYQICKKMYYAPKVVKEVKAATKRVAKTVKNVRTRMRDPQSSFHTAGAEM